MAFLNPKGTKPWWPPQAVIFLYLLDNNTSFVVLLSSGMGLAIEMWKVRLLSLRAQRPGFIQGTVPAELVRGKLIIFFEKRNVSARNY